MPAPMFTAATMVLAHADSSLASADMSADLLSAGDALPPAAVLASAGIPRTGTKLVGSPACMRVTAHDVAVAAVY